MIIHSFLTEGFTNWGVLLLRTLKKFNNEKYHVILYEMGLNKNQIKRLKSIYNNLTIEHIPLNIKEFCNKTGFNKKKMKELKNEVEIKNKSIDTKRDTLKWKQWVSVEKRYRESIIDSLIKNPNELFLHLDIDSIFYRNINDLEKFLEQNDVSIKFRTKDIVNRKKIVGGFIGIKSNENGIKFMKQWINEIDKKPLMKKTNGYGQLTLYLTYLKMKDKIKIGEMPSSFTANNRNYKKRKQKPFMLSANKGPKNKSLKQLERLVFE